MNLHLALPDLLWPDSADKAVVEGLSVRALETLLARGRRTSRPCADMEQWLLAAFGAGGRGSAPYALCADGGDPAGDVWMRADPCHLRADRDRLVLADAATFEVGRNEAEALAQALNEHFGVDGMTFYPMQPERWYVRLQNMPALHTTPLVAARGRDIDALLPAGEAGKQWHRLLNEMQMLLYQHAVNDARELRGELPINSLWLWGAGRYEELAGRPYARVRSRDPLAAGLGSASGAAIMPVPDDAAQWLRQTPADGIELIVLDQLAVPASYGDAHAWRTRLEELEHTWFAPLLEALRAGRIGMLTMHACGAGAGFDAETTRQDLRYFWRRPHALSTYADSPA